MLCVVTTTKVVRSDEYKAKRAMILGLFLGLVCHALPVEYRAMCDAVAQVAPHTCSR